MTGNLTDLRGQAAAQIKKETDPEKQEALEFGNLMAEAAIALHSGNDQWAKLTSRLVCQAWGYYALGGLFDEERFKSKDRFGG